MAGLAVVTITLCAAPAAIADGRAVIEPADRLDGMTGGEILGEGWARSYSTPAADHPAPGGCAIFGRRGRVLKPNAGEDDTASCSAERGSKVLVFWGSACSNVEPPPFYGADEAAQRACARAADGQSIRAVSVSVDRSKARNIRKPRYEIESPQRIVHLPPGNIFDLPPQPATLTAHAWAAAIHRLARGRHVIRFKVVSTEYRFTHRYTIVIT
jgi:hypothetical protein